MFRLLQCDHDGGPMGELDPMSEELVQACKQSAELYQRIGYRAPWVKVLERLGFESIGFAHDADAGEVWEWKTPVSCG